MTNNFFLNSHFLKAGLQALVLTVLCTACLLLSALPARADSEVEEIFTQINKINPGLKDSQADIDLKLQAKVSIIPYNTTMSGKYYSKTPDKHKLVMEKAPNYIKKYPNIFGFRLPKVEKYNSRVAGTDTIDGQEAYHIELLPKEQMGDKIREEMWVNTENYAVLRHVTFYKNSGELDINMAYREEQGFNVVSGMKATFKFPAVSVNANATATYKNYKFNQGLRDEFFPKY